MARLSIDRVAQIASGRSRMCARCPFNKTRAICPEMVLEACNRAFVEGFKKGVKHEKQIQRSKS